VCEFIKYGIFAKAGTWDTGEIEIRDVPGNTGRLATLTAEYSGFISLYEFNSPSSWSSFVKCTL